ncbi:Uncharacterized protein dnm_080930 [Desulfonema magnum]|uniref:Uncharacterized protein n=1 Tax=Desulfonema magnum TaxID=45655 RepID=A0A975BVK5_9BACT|nr:Uncharacterized protein dnm_080930 [Desulfonema magnum]
MFFSFPGSAWDSLPYTFYNNLILFYKLYVTQVPFMIDD